MPYEPRRMMVNSRPVANGPPTSRHTPVLGAPRASVSTEAFAGGPLPPGAEVVQYKKFEVVEQLGEGGMGAVYKAYDPSMDRYIALKVLKPNVPESERRKFHREAVIAANFSHPNLVRVLEVGSSGDFQWLAMEYLRGRDIGDVIANRKQLSFRLVVDMFAQVLDALHYAHTRAIAHCDIKPENIFVTRDAYDRRLVIVKLIDFGIAREFTGPIELQQYISGDPRYMPPEQAILNGPIDHRVDLYALGMTFYEVLCRRHPFEELMDQPLDTMIKAHRAMEPVPPSHFMPENTPPALAKGIDAFFERACAKRPEARYLNAVDMQKHMQRLLQFIDDGNPNDPATSGSRPRAMTFG
jgi:serine/threonine-protein kinase